MALRIEFRLIGVLLAEEQRADRELTVKPAARLVDRFGNEVGWELLLELVNALMRITPLRERHRTAVVPAIDHVGTRRMCGCGTPSFGSTNGES